MAYLQSNKISIFPTPYRGANYQPQARLVTEFNLINIVNRLVDKDSFVISYDPKDPNRSITFNIHGYWIKADLETAYTTGNLYASINVSPTEGTDFIELVGGDDGKGYTGVDFTTSLPSNTSYYLKLLADNQVPEDSWVKFTTDAETRSITIDDGDLDKTN